MTREEATRLMAGYLGMSASIACVGDLSKVVSDPVDRSQVSFALGKVVACIYEECMRPIIELYPELDPDKRVASDRVWAMTCRVREGRMTGSIGWTQPDGRNSGFGEVGAQNCRS